MEKSRDHKSKGVGSITLPTLYIIKEDGDPSLKLWAQTLLVEDRADQGESIVQWISKLREKVRSTKEICFGKMIANQLFIGCSIDASTILCQNVACNDWNWIGRCEQHGWANEYKEHSRSRSFGQRRAHNRHIRIAPPTLPHLR